MKVETAISLLLGSLVVVLVDIFIFNRHDLGKVTCVSLDCTVSFRPGDCIAFLSNGEETFKIGKVTATTITLANDTWWNRIKWKVCGWLKNS